MIILDQKDRALFTQPGEDLFMYTHIQLVEALCSFQNPVSTLDNQTTVITSQQGQIVKHGDIKCVLNEGMPIYHRPYEKGRLIIEFKVNPLRMAFSLLINVLCWKNSYLRGKK